MFTVGTYACEPRVCKSDVIKRDGMGGCSSINRNYASSEGFGGGFIRVELRCPTFPDPPFSGEHYICRPPEADVLKKERNNQSSLTPRTILKT
jgi:hypothetical protein